MKFNNKTFDVAKYVCLVGLPALATFVAAFGAIWGLPHTSDIVKTIVAVNLLASSLIAVKSVQYNNSDAKFDGIAGILVDHEGTPQAIQNVDLKDTLPASTANGQLVLKVQSMRPAA